MPLPPQPTRRGATVADARPAPLRPAPAVAQPRVPLAIEDWLTVVIMALLALITFANVLVRYFTSASFAWTEEVSVFLMIVLAMDALHAVPHTSSKPLFKSIARGRSKAVVQGWLEVSPLALRPDP